ncbi:integrase, catalytic region, zinc finger, CCHC-type containing protein [Tanacetum coccineum]
MKVKPPMKNVTKCSNNACYVAYHPLCARAAGFCAENRRDLPKDISLDRIEVLRYDTKGVKSEKGVMPTKTELVLEQTQQGASDEVLVSIEGVEELKRNVRIKGVKKEALHTLR